MRGLLIALVLLWSACNAKADERISDFLGELTINRDGSIDVTETIKVIAEGKKIKHGIFRDLPGPVEITSVKRDVATARYAIENLGKGIRVRIGSGDILLPPGSYTYQIGYRATGVVGFFEHYDEIYWNVTGNGWPFAIDHARSVVHLPAEASVIQFLGYTGYQGSNGKDYRLGHSEGAIFTAETTKVLSPNEGFTVAVGFTKGIVDSPVQAASAGNGYYVQLDSLKSEADAYKEFGLLKVKHASILGSLPSIVNPATVGGFTRYRLAIGPISSHDQATQICRSLVAAGQRNCLVRKQ